MTRTGPQADDKIPREEETLPNYDLEEYFPVQIGDNINSRYRVIGKLGYGSNSTVWFCRDLRSAKYVAVKIYVRTPAGGINREKVMYDHLRTLTSTHPGRSHIRSAIDSFEIERKSGETHVCFVHPPLQTTIFAFQRLGGHPQALPEDLVKLIAKVLLEALDFLHAEANITHCDLKLSNVMLDVQDEQIFEDYENAESLEPSDRKVVSEERTVYTSRSFRRPHAHAYGLPVLADFGEARIGSLHPHEEVQPDVYKAPEILMQTGWSHPVDIWNAGCMLWDMLAAEHLFDARDQDGFHNNRYHMREIVGLLGNPPQEFLRRSEHSSRLFDTTGVWKASPPICNATLDSREKHLNLNHAASGQFLDFLKSMLMWLPEERLTAQQLLQHPWLQGI